jgi:glycosyltransferase involved in cell wall biosynthesis
MVASLASRKPIVVSLMGSDIEDYRIGRTLIRIFAKITWNRVIVKSQRSKDNIKLKNVLVIPNGVNLDVFNPFPYKETRKKLDFNPNKKYVLFLAHPNRYEKNHALAKSTCDLVSQHYDLQLLTLDNTPHKEIPYFLSAVDVLLLTSLFEGSPNAIKEAMACNCPIVTTDVGDVKKIIGDTEGCYICSSELEDVAEKLKMALEFGERTSGRENIKNYDDQIIAHELLVVYKNVLKQS